MFSIVCISVRAQNTPGENIMMTCLQRFLTLVSKLSRCASLGLNLRASWSTCHLSCCLYHLPWHPSVFLWHFPPISPFFLGATSCSLSFSQIQLLLPLKTYRGHSWTYWVFPTPKKLIPPLHSYILWYNIGHACSMHASICITPVLVPHIVPWMSLFSLGWQNTVPRAFFL